MIRLRILGQLTLEQDDWTSAATLLGQPKRLALLVYLAAVHPAAPRSRDTLIALLWPEQDEAHARTGLRQALLRLRRQLGARTFTGMGDELVGVDPERLWCDAAAFTAALARGDRVQALALYGGPFLDGFHVSDAPEFERWVERERRRLELEAVAAAWHLVEVAEADGDESGARRWAERAIELAPYDETGFRRYLGVLERQADGAAAITAFAAYERRLGEDLGLEPSTETSALIERVRSVVPDRQRGLRPAPVAERPASVAEREPTATASAAAVRRRPTRWVRCAVGGASVAALAAALAVSGLLRTDPGEVRHPRTAIAVLPFRNLSDDSAHAYFAAGFQDELMTQFASVSALRLVGRTSVSSYQQKPKPLRQIGEELGVGAIVEASVQIVDNRFRIVVHLVDPFTQEDLWTERYERTLDDAFAVQSEIAQRIVAAVGATLTGAEAAAIRTAPTKDADAYQLYLQGLEYSRRPGLRSEDFRATQQLLERAVALDSTFAPAHAALADVHYRVYCIGYDLTPARLASARLEADKAVRLAPGLARARLATGMTRYASVGDHWRAIAEFRKGLRTSPSDPELWLWIGLAHSNLGNWDSAAIAFEHARALDPRNANTYKAIGDIRHQSHRFPEAIDAFRHASVLAPDFTQARLALAWSYIVWQGQTDTLRAVLDDIPPEGESGVPPGEILAQRINLLVMERQPDSLLLLLRARGGSIDPLRRATVTGEAHLLGGDARAARTAFDSALVIIDARLRASPDDQALHADRAYVLARLGSRAEALRETRWLENAHRKSPPTHGWSRVGELLALVGETDAALAAIERSLAHAYGMTASWVRVQPVFDGIRSDPRFQRLLVDYANPERH